MDINQAYSYIDALEPAGINYKLDTIRKALAAIGDPQLTYPAAIVAGTNGKGSTAGELAAILTAAGYRTGLYTSPHLVDLRERMRIDGRMIPKDRFASLTARLATVFERDNISPTHFEFTTAMVFEYFRNRVDFAVLEVGMGGRLDATNLCNAVVSIITPISFDHSGFLGSTLREIAGEKAAVIRRGRSAICAEQKTEAMDVIVRTAKRLNSRLLLCGREFDLQKQGGTYTYRGVGRTLEGIRPPLPGKHQVGNLSLALAAAEVLSEQGYAINEEAVKNGLAKVRWPARLQKIGSRPQTWLDGAHNQSGAEALDEFFSARRSRGKRVLVFGCSSDKQAAEMLQTLSATFDVLIACGADHPRAMPASEVASIGRSFFSEVAAASSPLDALGQAREKATPKGLVLATGSLFLAGEILRG